MPTLRGEYTTELLVPVTVRYTVEPADPGDRITPPSGPVVTVFSVRSVHGHDIPTTDEQRQDLEEEIAEYEMGM